MSYDLQIRVRGLAATQYREVVIDVGSITIDLGTLSANEAKELAAVLRDAVDDLEDDA